MAHQVTFDDVQRLIAAGMPVERLDKLLDRLELDQEEKAALWLAAWSQPGARREPEHIPGLYIG